MEVKNNVAHGRYELEVEGQTVFARYRREGKTLFITHVEAPPILRGTGAAGRLMRGMMEIIRDDGLVCVPLCSYAALWLARHGEYNALIKAGDA